MAMVTVRPMQNSEKDMSLLLKWLTNPQVLECVYGEDAPWDMPKIQLKFSKKTANDGNFAPKPTDGESAIAGLILHKDIEIGYFQFYPIKEDSYKFNNFDTYERIKDAYGIDMFIGEPELWGQGIGTQAITVIEEYLRNHFEVHMLCVDPSTENERGLSFWKEVGFSPIEIIENYDDSSKQSILMIKEI